MVLFTPAVVEAAGAIGGGGKGPCILEDDIAGGCDPDRTVGAPFVIAPAKNCARGFDSWLFIMVEVLIGALPLAL
jgi:hypothetical protein